MSAERYDDLIRISTAARERGVTRQSVDQAIRWGHLTVRMIDGRRYVVVDDRYRQWLSRPPGRNRWTPEQARDAAKRKSPE